MGITGAVAWWLAQPMLFPSLGPTVMMLAQHPGQHGTAPRTVMLAHGAALVAGWVSLWLLGLLHAPSALAEGITPAHIASAGVSVAATVVTTRALRTPHPPAGATTLIVSLGLLPTLWDLLLMGAAIVVATLIMSLYNRALGQPAPLWRAG
tara:strand:+ start:779 stop:1231 length:453 start_codon:yes stop_codon:yes gene_type:complete